MASRMSRNGPCSVDGCDAPVLAKRLCGRHYQRMQSRGTTDSPWLPVKERFWSKVDKSSDCWMWTAAIGERGYGVFGSQKDNAKHGFVETTTHRVAWVLNFGPIPAGLFVCHTCDNRRCVNPSHLFLGTALDNNRDRAAKGRSSRVRAKGSQHPRAKLTEAQIPDIRSRIRNGETNTAIADDYSVSHRTISNIKRGVGWTHVQEQPA